MPISFQEFMTEVFDKAYPYRERKVGLGGLSPRNRHFYTFNDKKGQRYRVHVKHTDDSSMADVDFSTPDKSKGSNFEKTGKSGTASSGVISTVKHIMRKHAEKHGIGHYTFAASDKEPSRQSLYNRMVRKHGGNYADSGEGHREYIVPTGVKRKK